MAYYLGIDTSNYTTSVCIYENRTKEVIMAKKLLPVPQNSVGLRQSDAVFSHIKQIHLLIDELFSKGQYKIKAVGVSTRPRSVEGSYMPAFLVGDTVASSIASVLSLKKYECSHQEGHIVSALYSANALDLLKDEFYAFHISGGTTEGLLIKPKDKFFTIDLLAKTLDLNAGQLVDRIGVMLGLEFPCGKALTQKALMCNEKFNIKPILKDNDINLSGVQNQCEKLYKEQKPDEYIARFLIETIKFSVEAMAVNLKGKYGSKPLLFAGGVMSNTIIKEYMQKKHNAMFASAELSCDNAAGVAIITAMKDYDNG